MHDIAHVPHTGIGPTMVGAETGGRGHRFKLLQNSQPLFHLVEHQELLLDSGLCIARPEIEVAVRRDHVFKHIGHFRGILGTVNDPAVNSILDLLAQSAGGRTDYRRAFPHCFGQGQPETFANGILYHDA